MQKLSSLSPLEKNIKKVDFLNNIRIERALSVGDDDFRTFFKLIPLLFHINHPNLPTYVKDCPFGVFDFSLNEDNSKFLQEYAIRDEEIVKSSFIFDAIYAMGSTGSISQTSKSDLDIWLCHHQHFTLKQEHLLIQKFEKIKLFAKQFNVEIHFYLMNPSSFRAGFYRPKCSKENSASSQHFFLLEEFYRSAILLCGKKLLWNHITRKEGQSYAQAIVEHIKTPQQLEQFIDFGDFTHLSHGELLGASLWQFYKGLYSPYKSALKILTLESYADCFPKVPLISKLFKEKLLVEGDLNYHYDPYIAMLDQVEEFLQKQGRFSSLEQIHKYFYIKITADSKDLTKKSPYQQKMLSALFEKWQFKEDDFEYLNSIDDWKVKQVVTHQQRLNQTFTESYENLIDFSKRAKALPQVLCQDSDLLMRQLYSTFHPLDNKVPLFNHKIKWQLAEPYILFIETKKGWHLLNTKLDDAFSLPTRFVQSHKNVVFLIAWAYFNGLIDAQTQIEVISQSVSLEKILKIITALQQKCSAKGPFVSRDAWFYPQDIRSMMIVVNLKENHNALKKIKKVKKKIFIYDLLGLSRTFPKIINQIDVVYRNRWNEIKVESFNGSLALLSMIKMVANHLYQSKRTPDSVQILNLGFEKDGQIEELIRRLVNQSIRIQTGKSYQKQLALRKDVVNKRWEKVFQEDNGIFQEQHISFDERALNLPKNFGEFAMLGAVQFFFENIKDGIYNVYVLDEQNKLDLYLACKGSKDQKVRFIEQIIREEKPKSVLFSLVQFYHIIENTNESGEKNKEIILFESLA